MCAEHKDEEAIFKAVIKLESQVERDIYLKGACGDNAGLLARIGVLLKGHYEAGGFLKVPTFEPARTREDSLLAEGLGTVIGHYKLLEKIGEGGMAVVYMAEQKEPVSRKVALKIIKLGMDTEQVIVRFEAEKQALALMDHPNIAKVFDAGATKTGRPYFVMELVKGVSITEHCDKNKLSTQKRLDLFIQVCHAVQHAHQKGIIHRDIKPTNVMVTLHDDRAVPKVIDFGIAKATNQQLTEKAVFTQYAQMIGTPEYMSPEQAQLSGLDIDTRTDIYSLGVLLYELLTGALPFDAEELRAAGYVEIQRIIREQEPDKPSTKLSAMGEALTGVAQQRKTNPGVLTKLLRGDLDWIVMKSLEKDRMRRYATASEVATDIERYLNSEPVLAGAPTLSYKLQKFVRRHRVSVTAGLLVAVALALGLAVATYGLFQVRQARDRAVIAEADAISQREEAENQREYAVAQQHIANKQRNEAKQSLYFSHILLARRDWQAGQAGRLREMLDAHRHQPGEEDLRGWEWYYLEALLHRDLLTLRAHTGGVRSVAWSPDGRRLASASNDQTITIWEAGSGKSLLSLYGHTGPVHSVAWSPDAQRLASGAEDGTIKVWDVTTGKIRFTIEGHTDRVHAVAFSQDGSFLASVSKDLTARIWEATTGKEVSVFKPSVATLQTLAWSPDDQRLATAGSLSNNGGDGVMLWDVKTKTLERTIRHERREVHSLAWSPDGKRLAAATTHLTVRVWDAATGRTVTDLRQHKGWVRSVSWSPDGSQLASAGGDQTIRIWDWATKEVQATLCGHTGSVLSVVWSPDGRRLASASEDGTVKIWDPTRTEEALDVRTYSNWISSVRFSPDGSRLATAYLKPDVEILDLLTQEVITLHTKTPRVWSVSWSPGGQRLATASIDGTVQVWNADGGPPIHTLKREKGTVHLVDWCPDGDRLASSIFHNKTVIIWNATTGERILTLPGNRARWSPDGRHLVSAEGGVIRIRDTATWKEMLRLTVPSVSWSAIAWSPDGQRLALGHESGTISFCHATTGEGIFSMRGHSSGVCELEWSPNGRRIASSSVDGTVKIRDSATGEEVLGLPGHFDDKGSVAVYTVAWSPDGRQLASGGQDSKVKFWDASAAFRLESGSGR